MGFKEKMATRTTRRLRGSNFLRLTKDNPSVIRILNAEPEVCWSHYIPKGFTATGSPVNNGKGGSYICSGQSTCPICEWNREHEDKKLSVRRLFAVNVLDRTLVKKCPECSWHFTPIDDEYPAMCENAECGADLEDVEPESSNRVKLLMKGKTISDQFAAFEGEFGPVTKYDIKMITRGQGNQANITCISFPAEELDLEEELGEDWENFLFDLEEVVKPLPLETLEKIFSGEDYFEVVE
jgi:hypothetical protein